MTNASTDAPDTASCHVLADRHQIEQAIYALGRCLDERDFDALRDLFTVDASVTTPGGTATGHDALVEQARHRHTGDEGIQHLITNMLIACDGDTATVRANLLVAFAHAGPADPRPFLLGEVYRFRLHRGPAGWRITTMTSTPIWSLNKPANLQANLPQGRPTAGPRAQTLAVQGLANRLVRGVLRTPLVCRAAGRRLIIVYVLGRKSGRRYAVPVAYTRQDEILLIGTPFAWGRNLRTGEPVDIRLKGRRRPADVEVLTDKDGVVENFAVMARDNHNFARFNKIGHDPAGNPSPDDLDLAWAAGARVIRLTPR